MDIYEAENAHRVTDRDAALAHSFCPSLFMQHRMDATKKCCKTTFSFFFHLCIPPSLSFERGGKNLFFSSSRSFNLNVIGLMATSLLFPPSTTKKLKFFFSFCLPLHFVCVCVCSSFSRLNVYVSCALCAMQRLPADNFVSFGRLPCRCG